MKDFKYLLLVICFVIFAHVSKQYFSDRPEEKFLPDRQSSEEQRKTDSLKKEVSGQVKIIPAAIYN